MMFNNESHQCKYYPVSDKYLATRDLTSLSVKLPQGLWDYKECGTRWSGQ